MPATGWGWAATPSAVACAKSGVGRPPSEDDFQADDALRVEFFERCLVVATDAELTSAEIRGNRRERDEDRLINGVKIANVGDLLRRKNFLDRRKQLGDATSVLNLRRLASRQHADILEDLVYEIFLSFSRHPPSPRPFRPRSAPGYRRNEHLAMRRVAWAAAHAAPADSPRP